MNNYKTHPKTVIGHIHLTVDNLEKSLKFYRDILGFEVTQKMNGAVFLSAGGYHHHIALNTWKNESPKRPENGQIGLYHFAILYPNRKELAKALKNLIKAKWHFDGASDHGVSESVYLRDPDGNSIELYADRDKKDWTKNTKGEMEMVLEPLNIKELLELD